MLGHQSWRAAFLSVISTSAFVSATTLPGNKRAIDDSFNPGPYALRLLLPDQPALNNYFFDGGTFVENPGLDKIQKLWAGPARRIPDRPDWTNNLYDFPGNLYLDDHLSLTDSPQLILVYVKQDPYNNTIPYYGWGWQRGPGLTAYWPGYWAVQWGGLRFVRQNETNKTFLYVGDNTTASPWRWAFDHYNGQNNWTPYLWNTAEPFKYGGQFGDIEVIPFEQLGTDTV